MGVGSLPPLDAAEFSAPRGSHACAQEGCESQDGVRCHFVDSHGRRCGSTWCPKHRRAIGGIAYCRRHANTILALGTRAADPLALPDLDNRGPSLVNWIYRDIDDDVRAMLAVRVGRERVAHDSAVIMVMDSARSRRWERSWKLVDAGGRMVHRLAVVVMEDDDALVHLRLDDVLVAKGVPPWIDRHRRHVEVSHTVDEVQRKLFYQFLIDQIPALLGETQVEAEASTA